MEPSDNETKSVLKRRRAKLAAINRKLASITDYDEKRKYLKDLEAQYLAVIKFCELEIEKIVKENEHDPEIVSLFMDIKNKNSDIWSDEFLSSIPVQVTEIINRVRR
jgi:hypothetical protein